jgi:tetratricopeptide (TPR) repeat protein
MNREEIARLSLLRYLESTEASDENSQIRVVISTLTNIWNLPPIASLPQTPWLPDCIPDGDADPHHSIVHACASLGRGHFDAALASLAGGTEKCESLEVLNIRTAAYLKRGNLEEAIRNCARAIEINPQNATAHIRMVQALLGMKRVPEARAAYRHGLECCPTDEVLRDLQIAVGSNDP